VYTLVKEGFGAFRSFWELRQYPDGSCTILVEGRLGDSFRTIPFPTLAEAVEYFDTYTTPIVESRVGEWTTLRWENESVWQCSCEADDNLRGYRNPQCENCRTFRPPLVDAPCVRDLSRRNTEVNFQGFPD
jgi:hypothetical protein